MTNPDDYKRLADRLAQLARVMRAARDRSKSMGIWSGDLKAVEDAESALRAAEPVKAGEVVAWADSHGLERPIDAEAMKHLRNNPTTEVYWSRFSIPLYAAPPTPDTSLVAMREALDYVAHSGKFQCFDDGAWDIVNTALAANQSDGGHGGQPYASTDAVEGASAPNATSGKQEGRTGSEVGASQTPGSSMSSGQTAPITAGQAPGPSDPYAGKVACYCHDPVSQRLCLDKNRCYTIEAQASTSGTPPALPPAEAVSVDEVAEIIEREVVAIIHIGDENAEIDGKSAARAILAKFKVVR